MDDIETTSYRVLRESVGSQVVQPLRFNAYRMVDFLDDTVRACRDQGGEPDVILLSSKFLTGFVVWGHATHRIDAGVNLYGTPIEIFETISLPGIALIEAPLLRGCAAICLNSSTIRMRVHRNERWVPTEAQDNPNAGEFVADMEVELDDPGRLAWVEGITGFANT
ncbi:MAG: hypothetical protein AB7G11_11190 [Phycisphaerales bacterium]